MVTQSSGIVGNTTRDLAISGVSSTQEAILHTNELHETGAQRSGVLTPQSHVLQVFKFSGVSVHQEGMIKWRERNCKKPPNAPPVTILETPDRKSYATRYLSYSTLLDASVGGN